MLRRSACCPPSPRPGSTAAGNAGARYYPYPCPYFSPYPSPYPDRGAGGRGSVREIDEPLDLVRVRVGLHPHNPKPDPNQVRELDETLDEGIACGFSAVRPLSGQQGSRGRLAAPRLGLSAEVGRGNG